MSKSLETERPQPTVITIDQEFSPFLLPRIKQPNGEFCKFILKTGELLPNLSELKMNMWIDNKLEAGSVGYNPYQPDMDFRKTPEPVNLTTISDSPSDFIVLGNLSPDQMLKVMAAMNEHKLDNLFTFGFDHDRIFPYEFFYTRSERYPFGHSREPLIGLRLEIRERFRKLQLEVFLPTAVYKNFKAKPDEEIFEIGNVSYHNYVYTRNGNLLVPDPSIDIFAGVTITVPPDKLKEIRAKFVITPEPKKTEVPDVFKKAFE